MEKETEDYVMQLEKRIVFLEGRVALLEARLSGVSPTPSVSPWPVPYVEPVKPTLQKSCSVCGIQFTDSLGRTIALGYACNRANCPSGVSYSYTTKMQNYGTVWADNAQLELHLQTNDIKPYNPITRGDLDL